MKTEAVSKRKNNMGKVLKAFTEKKDRNDRLNTEIENSIHSLHPTLRTINQSRTIKHNNIETESSHETITQNFYNQNILIMQPNGTVTSAIPGQGLFPMAMM